MAKICVVSDFNFSGSGYLNIIVPLCSKLSEMGHDIMAVGFGYRGDEHNFPYSIIPCTNFQEAYAMVHNLKHQWGTEILLVALDIPHQEKFQQVAKQVGLKHIGITPLENPPLTMSWAFILQQLDKVFFISQLGEDEAQKAGVWTAEHLVVGMDTNSWRLRTDEEYQKGRDFFVISPETFVVITVASNQERKHLSKAFEIISGVKKKGIPVKYILITQENSGVGWKLRDLALTYGIAQELMLVDAGITFKEVYMYYAMSDAYLLTSKAEGLCMPVMEAMSVGIPVVATACGSMPELLADNRGFLMETEYSHIDPWGNSRRDFPLAESGVNHLGNIYEFGKIGNRQPFEACIRARKYMEGRGLEYPAMQVDKAIREIMNVKE